MLIWLTISWFQIHQLKNMEVFLQLGLGLLLLAAQHAPATAVPSSQCQGKCGNVDIPYPFGIGANCSLKGFEVDCKVDQDGVAKPFIRDHELLSVSLTNRTVRVLNNIKTFCYNSSGLVEQTGDLVFNATNTPYLYSDVQNKFTVVGCTAFAYIPANDDSYFDSLCVSMCRPIFNNNNMSVIDAMAVDDESCSNSQGCCQASIPKEMYYYDANFSQLNATLIMESQIWNVSRCNYAALMEAETFNFSSTYTSTAKFNDANVGRAPMVMDWAVRDAESCGVAERNDTGAYACRSSNSRCVDSDNGPGYACICSQGYDGNPYLIGQDGCTNVDECKNNPCPSGGTCRDTVGGYQCSCRAGAKFSKQSGTCNPDTGLIIGVSIGFLGLMITVFCGQMIIQKRKLKKVKQEYFHQHGGLLLFERMKSEKGLAFTVFSEAELIHATNNFDKKRILGRGGQGTVYKGIVKDNIPVAVKRCALVDERQKKEFGQEMLILSQINHKNIVKLLGCCLEVEVPMLVYEFIPNGTLFELIHGKNQALQISFSSLLRIAHEAAEGLSFLHSYASPPILHGDVKTANILLDDNYMAKVSDFGASILAPSDKEQFVTLVQGTCGYLDPEYMQTCQLTDKSDVYSFGVVLLEILTGQLPTKLQGSGTQRCLTSIFLSAMKENNLDAVLVSDVKGQESMELLRGLAELAKQCLDMCGSNRPTMKEIADELNRLRKLSLHPWVRVDVEMEKESLLGGPSTSGSEIGTGTGYPMEDGEILPVNPKSSYYAR